jgi:L-rhamnose mutarotase
MTRRFCLTLDLKDDPELIAEYRQQHKNVWPEITESLRKSGVRAMEIYLLGTRMFMIMDVDESFSFDAKNASDRGDPRVQEWETFMWRFQQPLPQAVPGEKWLLMERIFVFQSDAD